MIMWGRAQSQTTFQNSSTTEVSVDAGKQGPPVKEVYYYYDQWWTGLAVSLYRSRTRSLSAIPEELFSIKCIHHMDEI